MKKKKHGLSFYMLIAMILGLIAGFLLGDKVLVIKPLGTIFVSLLKMCMVPIIFVSITLSVAKISDLKAFGRIGLKIFGFYCLTSVIASFIGIAWVYIVKPGVGFTGALGSATIDAEVTSVVDSLVEIVPTNIFQAFADAKLISIVFFSIMFGLAVTLIGDKKKPIVDLLDSLNDAIIKLINICLNYAPVGVFALMASVTGEYGMDVLRPMSKFIATEYLAMATQMFLTYAILLKIMGKINILRFISRAKRALITAFSTTSSAATVPVELDICESHLGVPKDIGGFSFPLGATVNQDGGAIDIPVCLIFTAQIYGMSFTPGQLITIIAMTLVMSIGAAGMPAGSTMFILMILAQFGLPTDAFALVLAIIVITDVALTTMNICGDMVCTTCVCRSEGVLNEKVWEKGYNPESAEE